MPDVAFAAQAHKIKTLPCILWEPRSSRLSLTGRSSLVIHASADPALAATQISI